MPEIGLVTYADDNTLHATNKYLETLHRGSDTLLKFFTDNILKSFMFYMITASVMKELKQTQKNITSLLVQMSKDI